MASTSAPYGTQCRKTRGLRSGFRYLVKKLVEPLAKFLKLRTGFLNWYWGWHLAFLTFHNYLPHVHKLRDGALHRLIVCLVGLHMSVCGIRDQQMRRE